MTPRKLVSLAALLCATFALSGWGAVRLGVIGSPHAIGVALGQTATADSDPPETASVPAGVSDAEISQAPLPESQTRTQLASVSTSNEGTEFPKPVARPMGIADECPETCIDAYL